VLRRAAQPFIEALARMLVYIADAKVDEPSDGLIENLAIQLESWLLLFMSFPTLFLLKDVATLFQGPRQILLSRPGRETPSSRPISSIVTPKSNAAARCWTLWAATAQEAINSSSRCCASARPADRHRSKLQFGEHLRNVIDAGVLAWPAYVGAARGLQP